MHKKNTSFWVILFGTLQLYLPTLHCSALAIERNERIEQLYLQGLRSARQGDSIGAMTVLSMAHEYGLSNDSLLYAQAEVFRLLRYHDSSFVYNCSMEPDARSSLKKMQLQQRLELSRKVHFPVETNAIRDSLNHFSMAMLWKPAITLSISAGSRQTFEKAVRSQFESDSLLESEILKFGPQLLGDGWAGALWRFSLPFQARFFTGGRYLLSKNYRFNPSLTSSSALDTIFNGLEQQGEIIAGFDRIANRFALKLSLGYQKDYIGFKHSYTSGHLQYIRPGRSFDNMIDAGYSVSFNSADQSAMLYYLVNQASAHGNGFSLSLFALYFNSSPLSDPSGLLSHDMLFADFVDTLEHDTISILNDLAAQQPFSSITFSPELSYDRSFVRWFSASIALGVAADYFLDNTKWYRCTLSPDEIVAYDTTDALSNFYELYVKKDPKTGDFYLLSPYDRPDLPDKKIFALNEKRRIDYSPSIALNLTFKTRVAGRFRIGFTTSRTWSRLDKEAPVDLSLWQWKAHGRWTRSF